MASPIHPIGYVPEQVTLTDVGGGHFVARWPDHWPLRNGSGSSDQGRDSGRDRRGFAGAKCNRVDCDQTPVNEARIDVD